MTVLAHSHSDGNLHDSTAEGDYRPALNRNDGPDSTDGDIEDSRHKNQHTCYQNGSVEHYVKVLLCPLCEPSRGYRKCKMCDFLLHRNFLIFMKSDT